MNRRALLRGAAALPVAAAAAAAGVPASPKESAGVGVLRLPNDASLVYRNAAAGRSAGIISIETALEQWGLSVDDYNDRLAKRLAHEPEV